MTSSIVPLLMDLVKTLQMIIQNSTIMHCCVWTDLEDCCDTPHTVRGDWYYPDGNVVLFIRPYATFRSNRGPNEVINGPPFLWFSSSLS